MSTVASGAATMKMISSTRITSTIGVTLISAMTALMNTYNRVDLAVERGEGATLHDAAGERFVDELAPRDAVARAIFRTLRDQGTTAVGLDMRGVHHPLHPRTRMALADLRLQPPEPSRWIGPQLATAAPARYATSIAGVWIGVSTSPTVFTDAVSSSGAFDAWALTEENSVPT